MSVNSCSKIFCFTLTFQLSLQNYFLFNRLEIEAGYQHLCSCHQLVTWYLSLSPQLYLVVSLSHANEQCSRTAHRTAVLKFLCFPWIVVARLLPSASYGIKEAAVSVEKHWGIVHACIVTVHLRDPVLAWSCMISYLIIKIMCHLVGSTVVRCTCKIRHSENNPDSVNHNILLIFLC